ncbi:cytochrome P450 [Mycobacterium parmense]|uniref:cytochrome P450 n=1 Tax=Mycobacterium parmense TaxID=185642 RepID=UPI0013747ABB|nr:cytochrome P450 [Mycobacterium parmense]MCV7351151.1 cytochrome P450 [Mycobacterium parmense]
MSRFALPPPPFLDENRCLIADDPRDYWRTLRDGAVFRELSGYYVLARGEDVRAALRDPRTFGSRRKELAPAGGWVKTELIPLPIAYDPPDHTRYRQILRPYFGPQAVNGLTSQLREHAAALVGAVASDGACEAIGDIADPYPFGALAILCGLPLEDRDKVVAWADDVIWDVPGSAQTSQLLRYLIEAIEAEEKPALAARLLTGDDPLTQDEVIGLFALLYFAQDGMQSAIGSALLHLARNPELRSLLRENPDQVRAFAEEVLRLETPLPFIGRFTNRDVTVAGVTIPAGSPVRLCLASANLGDGKESSVVVGDDGRIPPKQHRTFGGGIHRCLGKTMARMELAVIVTEWLRAVPDFELEPGFTPRFSFRQGGAVVLSRLPLRW